MSVTTPEAQDRVAQAIAESKARTEQYGKYRARGPIDLNGARAFNAGDAVPITHVEGGVRQVADNYYDQGKVLTRLDSDGQPKTVDQAFGPVVDRADVYEVGGKDDPVAAQFAAAGQAALQRPADNASLDKWQAYAVEQGMTPDEAAAITDKGTFVARYPKA